MSRTNDGEFSKNLMSLNLQMQTLMEGVGGEDAAQLLDTAAQLSDRERKIVMPLITRVLQRLIAENERLISKEDAEMKDFENALYESVMEALNADERQPAETPREKFNVVSGGKDESKRPVKISTLIDLAKAREARRTRAEYDPR